MVINGVYDRHFGRSLHLLADCILLPTHARPHKVIPGFYNSNIKPSLFIFTPSWQRGKYTDCVKKIVLKVITGPYRLKSPL